MKTLLVVDDNKLVAEALALRLNLFVENSRIFTAADGAEAVLILSREPVDYVLTDIRMPVMNGYELIDYCRKHHPRLTICAMTGEYTPGVLERLRTRGVPVCFEKPFDFDEVVRRVRDDLDAGRGVFHHISHISGLISTAINAFRSHDDKVDSCKPAL